MISACYITFRLDGDSNWESWNKERERRTEAHAPTSASSDLVENRIISFLYLFLLFDNELWKSKWKGYMRSGIDTSQIWGY